MHPAAILRGALCALLLAPQIAAAADQGLEITPVLGLRGGATLQLDPPGTGKMEADPSGSFGVVVDFPVRPDARAEFFFDRQRLEFENVESGSGPAPFDITVDYLHAGGVYEPRHGRTRPFVAAALGLSWLNADGGASLEDSLAVSGSLGGGTKIDLGTRLALRLELRGYANFTGGALQVTCGPGCSLSLQADGWYQFAARIGLVIRVDGKR